MKQTFSFEEASQASPIDAALQAEGVTGQTADIARSLGQKTGQTRWFAGLRIWF